MLIRARVAGFSTVLSVRSFTAVSDVVTKEKMWQLMQDIRTEWETQPIIKSARTKPIMTDLTGMFPKLVALEKQLDTSIKKSKLPSTRKGLKKLANHIKDLNNKCTHGDVAACATLSILDSMSHTLTSTTNSRILLSEISDQAAAYRSRFSNWRTAFDATDVDKSGDIDVWELQSMMESFGIKMEGDMLMRLFRAADLNKDGRIQPEEFERVLWSGGLLTVLGGLE